MHFEIVTLFPELIRDWSAHGVFGRALVAQRLQLGLINPRDFAQNVHRSVDDRPYGGGPGMVMQVEPLRLALAQARDNAPAGAPVIYLSPQGVPFTQAIAEELATGTGMVLLCGRYEGIDERVIDRDVDREISIGDYVLSGGEVPAMVIADAVARLIPGVLGDPDSAGQDSFSSGLLDCPHYTRPEDTDGQPVPAVLMSGDHDAIRRWRLKMSLGRTWSRRPALLAARELDDEQRELLAEYIAEAGNADAFDGKN